jgi:hypothetical protein
MDDVEGVVCMFELYKTKTDPSIRLQCEFCEKPTNGRTEK